ncbi:MAG: hypothetical protein ACLFPH_00540 [Bacteroidales bacterium]
MRNSSINKIYRAVEKFNLDLSGLNVLTEAATGSYSVTPVIAAIAGAHVYAYSKDSHYGTFKEVEKQTYSLAEKCNVEKRVEVIDSLGRVDLSSVNILTNTGFLRPVTTALISQLSSGCVIPYMFEPWEFRKADIDLEACRKKGIKVYGTNEEDERLKTFQYIGYTVLYFLLKKKLTPFSAKILVIGNDKFINPIAEVLSNNQYSFDLVEEYSKKPEPGRYNTIIIAERQREKCIIGPGEDCFMNSKHIHEDMFVFHIAGRVDFNDLKADYIPKEPAPFGYMSFNTDFIDSGAVIDLHTAGLKVGEGMLQALKKGLTKRKAKEFIENNYPALAFDDPGLW